MATSSSRPERGRPVRPPPAAPARPSFAVRFRRFRIAVGLAVLYVVAVTTWSTERRIAAWNVPLEVAIVPVIAEEDPAVTAWAAAVGDRTYAPVAAFLQRESARHAIATTPLVRLHVTEPTRLQPPPPPEDRNPLKVLAWSLRLRGWRAWNARTIGLPSTKAQIFVRYHAPVDGRTLDHSVGIPRVRIGVVNAFAGEEDAAWTNVAIVHELLHTVGASDKYGEGGIPLWPDGYADPHRQPRFPQSRAEVMAGHIALDATRFSPAKTLDLCVVGDRTATEIGWKKEPKPAAGP